MKLNSLLTAVLTTALTSASGTHYAAANEHPTLSNNISSSTTSELYKKSLT